MPTLPPLTSQADLENLLSTPTSGSCQAMAQMRGDLMILGAGGKMGPSLARLARRSANEAGRTDLRVLAVSRFSSPETREELASEGIETLAGDLSDREFRGTLPQVPNVLCMFGYKFSAGGHPSQYWATNAYLSGAVGEQFRQSRLVCFSSGNVYPFCKLDAPANESVPCAPIGEYAITVWGRERMLEYVSDRFGTPVCMLRLNYAVEPRYGVLVDMAGQLLAGEPINLAVPAFNCVWQGYANEVSLRAFDIVNHPPKFLNLTGSEVYRVREVAEQLADRLGVEPRFEGEEGDTALLNDSSQCHELFGPPPYTMGELIDMTASWIESGLPTLGKPTKFQVRDGKF